MRKIVIASLIVLGAAGSALAQDEKPFELNIGGGVWWPLGSYKDSWDTGGQFAIGGTFWTSPTVGIQAEYNYSKMNGPSKTLTLFPTPVAAATGTGILESNQHIHAGIFDVVFRPPQHGGAVGGYVLGGIGVYHRTIQLTSPAVGYTTICDPYWYVCYPAAVPVDQIIGDRSSNDFGINFGGGLTFGHTAKFYVEARYHYVWGPDITKIGSGNTSGPTSTNSSYLPLTFGVRF
jgi:opacity protein-like surface antigen